VCVCVLSVFYLKETQAAPEACITHVYTVNQGWPISTHRRATKFVRTRPKATYIERGGGNDFCRTPLFTKTTFLLLFIKVAILYSVDLLYIFRLLNCITENIDVTKGRKYFPRWLHVGQPWCKPSKDTERSKHLDAQYSLKLDTDVILSRSRAGLLQSAFKWKVL
jgi:hypothetical protein